MEIGYYLICHWRFPINRSSGEISHNTLETCRKAQIYYHNGDYFIIRFKSMEERNEVLYSGSNTIKNRHVIMKEWSADLNFKNKILKTIPI